MKKKIGIGLVLVILAVALLGIFYYITHHSSDNLENSTEEASEIQQLISKNIETNYPATPRAVTNLYSRMLACMYNEDYSDDELTQLLDQMYLLYDTELQEENPIDTFYESMTSEAQDYKSKNWTISNYTIPDSDEVTYDTIDGNSFAALTVSYFVKEDTSYVKSLQNYMLRKDEDGNWKIYGYSLENQTDDSQDE